jgi:hypothetical protein
MVDLVVIYQVVPMPETGTRRRRTVEVRMVHRAS